MRVANESRRQEADQPRSQGRVDTDQDGLFNDDETNVYGTNPNKADSDGDGRDDGQEVFDKTDPNNPSTDPGRVWLLSDGALTALTCDVTTDW